MSRQIELSVSQEDVEKLQCSYCKGYLLCSPIRILSDGGNICGHCDISGDVAAYRNTTLELILKNAVFPCKYHLKGCSERLRFSPILDHERCCPFNTPNSNDENVEQTLYMSVEDNNLSTTVTSAATEPTAAIHSTPKVVKSSGSVTDQLPGSLLSTKKETASTSQANSVCSDIPSTTRWNDDSRMDGRRSSNSSRNSNVNRPRSSISNSRSWYRNRTNYSQSGQNRPYHLDWRFNNNLPNRQNQFRPEHVTFKRRNNIIIVKGGTFYVNW